MITPLADRAQNRASPSQEFDVVYEARPEELGQTMAVGCPHCGWISYSPIARGAVSGQCGGVCSSAARSMVGCC
jgi:hypothetical protein